MKNIIKTLLIITPVLLFAGCSSEEGNIAEQASDKVDEITTEAADAAVKKIRTPLDKARATKDLGEERMKAMDQAVQNK
ncbi:MAG: hypothetical protein ABFQ82_05545 [Thermodesulfobacteriota bacterium]